MKSFARLLIALFCYSILWGNYLHLAQAQNQRSKLFSGQVLRADNVPVKGTKVFFDGFPNISSETDPSGSFELKMPASFAITDQTIIYVGNKKIERSGFAYNSSDNALIIKLKDELPDGAIQVIEIFDEKNQSLPKVSVQLKGKRFKTDEKGQIIFNSPPYLKANDLDNEQIKVEGYEVSSIYYLAANHRFFIYLKSSKPIADKQETAAIQQVSDTKPPTEQPTGRQAQIRDVIKQDFSSVLNELEMEKQFLSERSSKIRDKIEKIATRLSNQTLSEDEKSELRKYLNRLEKQLIENDLAYERAQERIKQAIDQMRLEVMSKDSLNAAAAKKIARIAAEKEAAIKEKEAIEALYQARLLIGFIILVILAGAAIVSYMVSQKLKRQTQEIILQRNSIEEKNKNLEKAYVEIQSQKTEIERQNHQITTSIRYAESIQQAILPPASTFHELFKDHFIYYRPKDIVSGDFYWCYSDGNRTLLAVVDCTGHGVPGAFMSLIGYNLLNDQVKQHGFGKPSLILKGLDKNLRLVLRQEQKVNNDSMDVGICLIEGRQVQFAGAKRTLLIYRAQTDTLEEIRGDRRPIGGFKKDVAAHSYQDHLLRLHTDDCLYLFTDGITDQPNPQLHKFGYQQLKDVILLSGSLSMEHQRNEFDKALEKHRQNTPIRDDMTLLAVRIG
ncbi:SpoIIE family protein phosphatase [Rhodoflexus sp.]